MMLPHHYGLATCYWQISGLASAYCEGRMGCMSIAAKPKKGRHDVRGLLSTECAWQAESILVSC